jgi:hypothetical protein
VYKLIWHCLKLKSALTNNQLQMFSFLLSITILHAKCRDSKQRVRMTKTVCRESANWDIPASFILMMTLTRLTIRHNFLSALLLEYDSCGSLKATTDDRRSVT